MQIHFVGVSQFQKGTCVTYVIAGTSIWTKFTTKWIDKYNFTDHLVFPSQQQYSNQKPLYKAACKRTQQLPTLLAQQCWDLQCIVGRILPISLCKPCVMRVRGPNNVRRAVQTDLTLLRYASAIMEQKKCWELLGVWLVSNFAQQHATTSNNMQQGVQTEATCNIQQYWDLLANNVSSVCTGLNSRCCCCCFLRYRWRFPWCSQRISIYHQRSWQWQQRK